MVTVVELYDEGGGLIKEGFLKEDRPKEMEVTVTVEVCNLEDRRGQGVGSVEDWVETMSPRPLDVTKDINDLLSPVMRLPSTVLWFGTTTALLTVTTTPGPVDSVLVIYSLSLVKNGVTLPHSSPTVNFYPVRDEDQSTPTVVQGFRVSTSYVGLPIDIKTPVSGRTFHFFTDSVDSYEVMTPSEIKEVAPGRV